MDGVLLKGSNVIPGAPRALKLLQERNIPWIVMTNGGGISESQRAQVLTEKLGFKVDVEQIVQSHTPMVSIPGKEKQTVLVIGGIRDNTRAVAQEYGFKRVLITADYVKTAPSISPFKNKETIEFGQYVEGIEDMKVDKILVFNDPRDLWTDIQVVSDILKKNPDTHVVFSNNDWLWANEYPSPRYGQGVVRFLFEQMYREEIGKPLNRTILGKPTKFAYDFAHHVLINRSLQLSGLETCHESHLEFGQEVSQSHMKQVFMVGDNPASDIIGGYNYGWNTALVRTGVYKDGDKLPCPPTVIGDTVHDVVKNGLKLMGLW
jgi:HAD superfamily hydrolase (TIGR01456 family)